jgi:hypothetical protein
MDNNRQPSRIIETDNFYVNLLFDLGWELMEIFVVKEELTYVLGWFGDGEASYPEFACC